MRKQTKHIKLNPGDLVVIAHEDKHFKKSVPVYPAQYEDISNMVEFFEVGTMCIVLEECAGVVNRQLTCKVIIDDAVYDIPVKSIEKVGSDES